MDCPWCDEESGVIGSWDDLDGMTWEWKVHVCAACGKPVHVEYEENDDIDWYFFLVRAVAGEHRPTSAAPGS
jgi:transcription elongation factor Elf1